MAMCASVHIKNSSRKLQRKLDGAVRFTVCGSDKRTGLGPKTEVLMSGGVRDGCVDVKTYQGGGSNAGSPVTYSTTALQMVCFNASLSSLLALPPDKLFQTLARPYYGFGLRIARKKSEES